MINVLTTSGVIWVKKVKVVLSVIWSFAALGGASALTIATIYWFFEPAHTTTVWHSTTNISASAGSSARVPMVAPPAGNKVMYKVQLIDDLGNVTYDYPSIVVDNVDYTQLGKLLLKLPTTIRPGEYMMSAEMTYMMNPLKTNTVKLELARVKIAPATKGESNASGFN